MTQVAEHVAGGLWLTQEVTPKLLILDQFYRVEDFRRAAESVGMIASGRYSFNQTSLNISGVREDGVPQATWNRVHRLLNDIDVAKSGVEPLLDKDMVHDLYETISEQGRPPGMGHKSVSVLCRVIELDVATVTRS